MSLPTNFFIGRGGEKSVLTEYLGESSGNFTTHVSNVYTYRGLTTVNVSGWPRRWVLTQGQNGGSEDIRFGTIDRSTGVFTQTNLIQSSTGGTQRDRYYDGSVVYISSYSSGVLYGAGRNNFSSSMGNINSSDRNIQLNASFTPQGGTSVWGLAHQSSIDRLHIFTYNGASYYVNNFSTNNLNAAADGTIGWQDSSGNYIDASCGAYDYDRDVFYIGRYSGANGVIYVCNPDGTHVHQFNAPNTPTNFEADSMHYDDGMLAVQWGGNFAINGTSGYNLRLYAKNI